MSITNYAIIDRVGSISTNIKFVNKAVYDKAEKDGFKDKVYEMKKICMADSPYAKEVTDKMKWRVRHTKNPEKVYFVCPELNYYTERELKKWYDRCIDVVVYEANTHHIYDYKTEYDLYDYSFHDTKTSIKDRIAEMWGPAFGENFDAPITRIDNTLDAYNYCKRPDHDAIVASGETHFTKPFTRKERFYQFNCSRLTKAQRDEFLTKFDYYLKVSNCTIDTTLGANFGAVSGNVELLKKFLDIDYTICENCSRPHKLHQGDIECPHCQTVFTEEYILGRYFEDNYTDEYEDNPYMDYENTILTPNFFPEELSDEWQMQLY